MKSLLCIVFVTGSFLMGFSQDNFANALESLRLELQFKPTSESYIKADKPNKKFIDKFKECEGTKELEKLGALNFNCIVKVKSSELFTSKWKGKWQIEFREWEFKTKKCATEFVDVLDNLSPSRFEFCVNKGGIMWWRDESKVYILTSRAKFVAYHYKEIKKAIIKGLVK